MNLQPRFLGCHIFIPVKFFCLCKGSNWHGCQGGQFSLHLSRQINRGLSLSVTKTARDRRTRWCHLSTIAGTTSHCRKEVSTL